MIWKYWMSVVELYERYGALEVLFGKQGVCPVFVYIC